MCKRRLWKWAYLFMEAPLGNLERGVFTRNSERQMKDGSGNGASLSLYGSSVRGTWRGAPLLGGPEGYVKEGSGNRHLSA
jgi:hypothetical protein